MSKSAFGRAPLLSVIGPAIAACGGTEAAAAAAGQEGPEEVIVTAQKRSQDVQKAAISFATAT